MVFPWFSPLPLQETPRGGDQAPAERPAGLLGPPLRRNAPGLRRRGGSRWKSVEVCGISMGENGGENGPRSDLWIDIVIYSDL